MRYLRFLLLGLLALGALLALALPRDAEVLSDPEDWSYTEPLNSSAAEAHWFHDHEASLTTDREGTWIAAWVSHDSGPAGTPTPYVQVARSTDNGETWALPTPLNPGANADSGDVNAPQVATDAGQIRISSSPGQAITGQAGPLPWPRTRTQEWTLIGIGIRRWLPTARGTGSWCGIPMLPTTS